MPAIFLSYARRDAQLVQALAGDLRALGNAVWLDEEVSSSQTWWDQILAQIRGCEVFVFALSPTALDSPACGREWDYAVALGKPVLPIWLTGEEPRHRLDHALGVLINGGVTITTLLRALGHRAPDATDNDSRVVNPHLSR